MSSSVILTWMEISFVFITVVFCFGSLFRKVSKSSGPGEQLLELWSGVKSRRHLGLAGTEGSIGICVWNASFNAMFYLFLFCLICLGVPLKSVILVFLFVIFFLSDMC